MVLHIRDAGLRNAAPPSASASSSPPGHPDPTYSFGVPGGPVSAPNFRDPTDEAVTIRLIMSSVKSTVHHR